MLSSKDYFLIEEWLERGYSKERIFRGIRNAFEQMPRDKIRNVYDCREHVENFETKISKSETSRIDEVESKDYIDRIINNFDHLISGDIRPNLLELHNKFRSRLLELDLSKINIFTEINKIEEEYFEQFSNFLNEKEKSKLNEKIVKAVNAGNDYINEESKKKALNIHLKNLIIKEYIFFNPFETDN